MFFHRNFSHKTLQICDLNSQIEVLFMREIQKLFSTAKLIKWFKYAFRKLFSLNMYDFNGRLSFMQLSAADYFSRIKGNQKFSYSSSKTFT